jgi:hypothetical protein
MSLVESKTDRLLATVANATRENHRSELGDFVLRIGPEYTLPQEIKRAFEDFLNRRFIEAHRIHSQPNKTLFQTITGLPSPIVRIDASPIIDLDCPEKSIYEIEARPSGLGILSEHLGVVDPIVDVFRRLENRFNLPLACGVLPSVTGQTGGRDRSEDTKLLARHTGMEYLYQPWRS